jgi:iron complex outermembrane receptor protein
MKRRILASGVCLFLLCVPIKTFSQDILAMDSVIVGSVSNSGRVSLKSPVPVQMLSSSRFIKGQPDLSQQIANNFPSFSSPPQTVGSSAVVNPGALRGLGPDETLVLLNGHRVHTSSSIFLQYSLAYGTTYTDLNTIPVGGLARIEVLTDGAGAQYGADAIAGVINLIPKTKTGVTSVNFHTGQTYKGDGSVVFLDINRGIKLGGKGYINLTGMIKHNAPTQRNGVWDSTVYYNIPVNATPRMRDSLRTLDNTMISQRGFDRKNHRRIGNPEILNTGFMANGLYTICTNADLYITAVYNFRNVKDIGSTVYRYPKDSATTGNIALFPNGYGGQVRGNIQDYTLIAGIRSRKIKVWKRYLSQTSGYSYFRTDISNKVKASLAGM